MKKVKLKSGAFLGELTEIVKPGQIGWASENHRALVDALLNRIEDDGGNAVTLDENAKTLILAILCPNLEVQAAAIRIAFEQAGLELDAKTRERLELLSTVAGFGAYLATNNNPATGKPFVGKAKRPDKKAKFAALLTDEPEGGTTQEAAA